MISKAEWATGEIMKFVDAHVEKLSNMDSSLEEDELKRQLWSKVIDIIDDVSNEAYQDGMQNERWWGQSGRND